MAKRRHRDIIDANKKIWTLVCLALVLVSALLLRGVVIYKYYPLEHQQIIERHSSEYAVDPYLVSAVIFTESRFNEAAVSPKGAVGLMQIMPDTGEWIAGKIGIDGFDTQMLTDPDVNIRMGCWYLRYLDDRFSGDMDKVLAAYNAGPRNVSEWSGDAQLTDIPFPETARYLEKVNRSHYIYKGLYNDF